MNFWFKNWPFDCILKAYDQVNRLCWQKDCLFYWLYTPDKPSDDQLKSWERCSWHKSSFYIVELLKLVVPQPPSQGWYIVGSQCFLIDLGTPSVNTCEIWYYHIIIKPSTAMYFIFNLFPTLSDYSWYPGAPTSVCVRGVGCSGFRSVWPHPVSICII